MAKANPFLKNDQNPAPGASAPQPSAAPLPGKTVSEEFEVDLTNADSGTCIPDGLYKVRCIEVEQSVSSAGNPMFVWTFVITSHQEYSNRDYKSFTAQTPAAMWKVAEMVQALGVGDIGHVVKFKRSDVLNKECGAYFERQLDKKGVERSQISRTISMREYNEVISTNSNN